MSLEQQEILSGRMKQISLDKITTGVYDIHTMKRVNYHLTEEQIRRLQSLAERTGLTVAEIIRRAVDEYLDRREKRIKESDAKK